MCLGAISPKVTLEANEPSPSLIKQHAKILREITGYHKSRTNPKYQQHCHEQSKQPFRFYT